MQEERLDGMIRMLKIFLIVLCAIELFLEIRDLAKRRSIAGSVADRTHADAFDDEGYEEWPDEDLKEET